MFHILPQHKEHEVKSMVYFFVTDLHHSREWRFTGVSRQCDRLSETQRDSVTTTVLQVTCDNGAGLTIHLHEYINIIDNTRYDTLLGQNYILHFVNNSQRLFLPPGKSSTTFRPTRRLSLVSRRKKRRRKLLRPPHTRSPPSLSPHPSTRPAAANTVGESRLM